MGTYQALVPCTNTPSCYAHLPALYMPQHLAWHASLNNNNALIKVILPGLNVAAV